MLGEWGMMEPTYCQRDALTMYTRSPLLQILLLSRRAYQFLQRHTHTHAKPPIYCPKSFNTFARTTIPHRPTIRTQCSCAVSFPHSELPLPRSFAKLPAKETGSRNA